MFLGAMEPGQTRTPPAYFWSPLPASSCIRGWHLRRASCKQARRKETSARPRCHVRYTPQKKRHMGKSETAGHELPPTAGPDLAPWPSSGAGTEPPKNGVSGYGRLRRQWVTPLRGCGCPVPANTLPARLSLPRHAFLPISPAQWGALFSRGEEKSGRGPGELGGSQEPLPPSGGLLLLCCAG